MNEVDFHTPVEGMADTALWDVRRITLTTTRRDDATPVRYFEDAVSETLRGLHRLSQESLWDELQKHDLGKRTLRALAAEYKPARMEAFEACDLRRASVQFWEALRVEDDAVREALTSYDYGAVCGLLGRLSGTMEREVVRRLVYINCPRQNVVEEVVGTLQRCTTNELKMLASKLYDRLDKTGGLTAESRDMARKLLRGCKTKEELRMAVRDLLALFKRKPPPGAPHPSSPLISPAIATVTVSYKGQQRQVAAVVRIERLDKIAPEEPKVEAPPPPLLAPPTEPQATAAAAVNGGGSAAHSVVTVKSDHTIPPSTSVSRRATDLGAAAAGGTVPSRTPSVKNYPSRTTPMGSTRSTPLGSDLGDGGGLKEAGLSGSVHPLPSPWPTQQSAKPTPPGSVVGVAGPAAGSEYLLNFTQTPKASPPGSFVANSVVKGGGGDGGGAAAATSDLGSVRDGSHAPTPKSSRPPSVVVGSSGAAAATAGPGSDVGSTRTGLSHKLTPASSTRSGLTHNTKPPVSVLGGNGAVSAAAPTDGFDSPKASARTTPASSMNGYGGGGAPLGPGSDVSSIRTGLSHKPMKMAYGVGDAAPVPAFSGPGSEVGSTRSGITHKTTPSESARSGAAAALGSASSSLVGGSGGGGSKGSSGPESVRSRAASSQGSLPALALHGRSGEALTGGSSQGRTEQGYGSISFDHPGLPPPTLKPVEAEGKDEVAALAAVQKRVSDGGDAANDGGSERSLPRASSRASSVSDPRAPSSRASSVGEGGGRRSGPATRQDSATSSQLRNNAILAQRKALDDSY